MRQRRMQFGKREASGYGDMRSDAICDCSGFAQGLFG
ncbi:MAG: hypothetical protein JWQ64_287 [Subtercola sp.]|jgi:hypothetical protein|nr:hypothetical protein [Subtercola sp.]